MMVIALAAYTSSVQQKIHETMAKSGVSKRGNHLGDILWLEKADITLVVAGIAVLTRIAGSMLGYQIRFLDRLILCLLSWSIAFFSCLHIRQFILGKWGNDVDGIGIDTGIVDAIVIAINAKTLTNEQKDACLRAARKKVLT